MNEFEYYRFVDSVLLKIVVGFPSEI